MKLLDTSVIVDQLRGRGAATELLERIIGAEDPICASELSRFELLAGVRPDEQGALETFFLTVDWVPVTEDIARRAGEYAVRYRRSHSGIGVVDYLVAGTAAALGARLLTTNVRHFPMIDDLRVPYG